MKTGNSLNEVYSLKAYRILLLLGATLYPVWHWVYKSINPDFYESLSGRVVLSGLIFLTILGTYVSDYIRKNIGYIFCAALWLLSIHYVFLLYKNHASLEHVLGLVVVVSAVGASFPTVASLAIYLSGMLLLTTFSATLLHVSLGVFLLMTLGLGTVSIVLYISLRSRHHFLADLVARERELILTRAQAETASRLSSLGVMASGIAHEINNPLTIIQGKVKLALQKISSGQMDSAYLSQVLAKIDETTQRIGTIVRGLRAFARDGEHDPMRTIAVSTIVENTLAICQERFRMRGIDIQYHSDVSDLKVECSEVQISQVLLNLLSNAYDALENLPEKWIKVEGTRIGEKVEITVIDSGPGISSEIAKNIFEPFFTTKDPGKGTGLGLSISKRIVDRHRGELRVANVLGHTAIVLVLPVAQSVLKQGPRTA